MIATRPASLQCVVCATPLARAGAACAQAADPYPTCSTVACRMVVTRREAMGEAGFKHYLQLQSRLTMERAADMQVAHARVNAEARENTSAWAALRTRAPVMDEGEGGTARELLRLLVPSGPARVRALSKARRARYHLHLLTLTGELDADGAPPLIPANGPAAPASVASAMPGHLCGLCGGGCCTLGGEHAYLTADTLRRVLAQQPALSARALVADYLERLPAASQAGSCINHTARGCALPTSLRSDICNNYACEALARLQHLQRTSAAPHVVLVVRRKQDNWQRKDTERDNSITARAVLTEAGCTRFTGAALRISDEPRATEHLATA